ncbi:hypothetical protein L861_14105 [Litchfieldella anticariensis FP35 = DSM 16096]|uniref:diguanylate cyclase n=2 Tax=Litchfieldella anticariensis TaxID=258591 RepID=S2KJ97_LITA3|nr:hypothetical protein L861_14105 [Halomonas anticariensis FP35 = DSM 16096]
MPPLRKLPWGRWAQRPPANVSGPDHRRSGLSNFFLMIIALISLSYAMINIFYFKAIPLAVVELTVFVIVVLALVDMRVNQNVERAAWLSVISCGGLAVFFYWYVRADVSSAVWMVFFAIINFFLLGTRKGLPVYLIYCGVVFSIVLVHRDVWPALQTGVAMTNILGALIGFGAVAYYQERSREKAHEQIEALANKDSLTGISNRRHFLHRFRVARQTLINEGKRYALVVIDIDHFKPINDTHGHAVGDQVIVAVIQRITAAVRQDDIVARLGGEEFCVLLIDCDGLDAQRRTESLRRAVAEQPVKVGTIRVDVTISIGVTDGDPKAVGFNEMFAEADKFLYMAKARGRNCVVPTSTISL